MRPTIPPSSTRGEVSATIKFLLFKSRLWLAISGAQSPGHIGFYLNEKNATLGAQNRRPWLEITPAPECRRNPEYPVCRRDCNIDWNPEFPESRIPEFRSAVAFCAGVLMADGPFGIKYTPLAPQPQGGPGDLLSTVEAACLLPYAKQLYPRRDIHGVISFI